MTAAKKNWFDDWELSITGWDDGQARIDIALPHNDVTVVQIWSTKQLAPQQANVLDKLLCELTGTKKGITDGNTQPGTDGSLGRPAADGTSPAG